MLLAQPINDLNLSIACKENLKCMNVTTLQEFIDKGWSSIRSCSHFEPLLFNEVISLLRENDLLHLMEGK